MKKNKNIANIFYLILYIVPIVTVFVYIGTILYTSIFSIDKANPHTSYNTPLVSSYRECLGQDEHTIEGTTCISKRGWEFPKPHPTKPSLEYKGYSLETNQFISSYNLIDSLSFTLDIPDNCELINEDPQYKHLRCDVNNGTVIIRPSDGGRGLGNTKIKDYIKSTPTYGDQIWDNTLYLYYDGTGFSTYTTTHSNTSDYFLITIFYDPYSQSANNFVDDLLNTLEFGKQVYAN